MERLIRLGFFLCILLSAPLYADDIRSWVDADGTVHFGDKRVAPPESEVVELGPASIVELVPLKKVPPVSSSQSASAATAPRPRPCTPVTESYVDPKTGMHSQRETGRCAEDGDMRPADDYPYYYWGPCNGPSCIRPPLPPRPDPPPRPSNLPSRPAMGGFPLVPYR